MSGLSWAIAPLLIAALWACADAPTASPSAGGSVVPGVTLTEADNERAIVVARGETIRIRLRDAAGTGFQWKIELSDPDVLEVLESDYIQSAGARVGGAGQRLWLMRAKAVGSVRLSAKRWRPWEGEQSVVERFAVSIQVSP
jgi:inhibitor of cysteine peptidase